MEQEFVNEKDFYRRINNSFLMYDGVPYYAKTEPNLKVSLYTYRNTPENKEFRMPQYELVRKISVPANSDKLTTIMPEFGMMNGGKYCHFVERTIVRDQRDGIPSECLNFYRIFRKSLERSPVPLYDVAPYFLQALENKFPTIEDCCRSLLSGDKFSCAVSKDICLSIRKSDKMYLKVSIFFMKSHVGCFTVDHKGARPTIVYDNIFIKGRSKLDAVLYDMRLIEQVMRV